MPKTWAEFNADCDKIVAAGFICIVASRPADWTDATTFEVVVYGQDIDLFKKAFVEGDVDALRSEGMVKAFDADAHHGLEVHGPRHCRPRL